ncbi:DUF1048 domain-containing protein [Lactococcus lactis]|uniref:DUF1048 domain-containing protein n=1 Tax=Lactococcus lactis TaxID=1358 RepID=UPI00398227AA
MVLDKISDLLAEKKDWQEMQNRAKKLPKDFYQAYRSIQKYMFKMGQQIGIFLRILLNYLSWQ